MSSVPRSIMLACLLALPSCGSNDNDPGPGGVTVGEAEALNQAAEMLDDRLAGNATGAKTPGNGARD
ncbi:hypothetical protein [Rhizorhapis suberifaciens]|uniref:Uncharacterized protein n=1 Tax=Rhizorhapis suberifaciens TaxID=13656 RepID=A0A840HVK8_9SPHN|nr:hypothetical protein [Rhizorhapis suberifaciens]MBB4641610.1 hypothetical protein [Rhizorhapis suberifaciens]